MKFNCGPTPEEKFQAEVDKARRFIVEAAQWKDKFAIFPVRVASGDCRWLEYIQVREIFTGDLEYIKNYVRWGNFFLQFETEYRAKDND